VSQQQTNSEVTQLLEEWGRGDDGAVEKLMPLVYNQLKSLAASHMRRERKNHTLQPTALIHETFLRLAHQSSVTWRNRRQFFAVAARAMRQVLVDHARQNCSSKRGSHAVKISLSHGGAQDVTDPRLGDASEPDILCNVVDVDSALEDLNGLDPELARIVELRFFAGFTIEETATVMSISTATVKRGWATARAWLFDRLRPQS
jgi:RNA polymerase sigma factor (TIGR02999 family)